MSKQVLTKEEESVLKKSYLYTLQNFIGPNNMVKQGRTFALSILPGLKAWSKTEEDCRQEFDRTANQFFNTNAVLFPLHTGITLAMEKKRIETDGELSSDAISSMNAALQGPTAAIGDSLVFNCYRIIIAGIAIELSAGGNVVGPLFFLLFYGVGQIVMKWYALRAGYKYGNKIIDMAFKEGIIPLLTQSASILGGVMVGAILASRIKLTIALVPNIFGATINIQNLLDSLMPGLLSLVIWYLAFRSLQKGWSPVKLIFVIIALCIIAALLGIVV